jgi:hypothetical protein
VDIEPSRRFSDSEQPHPAILLVLVEDVNFPCLVQSVFLIDLSESEALNRRITPSTAGGGGEEPPALDVD